MYLRQIHMRTGRMAASGGANLNLSLEMGTQQALAASSSSDAAAAAQQYLAENKANQSGNLVNTQSTNPMQQITSAYDPSSTSTYSARMEQETASRATSESASKTIKGAPEGDGPASGGGVGGGRTILGGRGHWNDLLDI